MNEPLQKRIDRAGAKAMEELQKDEEQRKKVLEQDRHAECSCQSLGTRQEVLRDQYASEVRQIAEHRKEKEELQRRIDMIDERIRHQEGRHNKTRKEWKDVRKQLRTAEKERDGFQRRMKELDEKKNRHEARHQENLERILEKYLEECWAKLRNGDGQAADGREEALTRLEGDRQHREETRLCLEELDFWEHHPAQAPENVRLQRIDSLRGWLEQRYPGALAARARKREAGAIPAPEEIFYRRHDRRYTLPLPVPRKVWAELGTDEDGVAEQDCSTALLVLWAVLEKLPRETETRVSVDSSSRMPVLHCDFPSAESAEGFPDTITVRASSGATSMDFLLSEAPLRLENSRLFKP